VKKDELIVCVLLTAALAMVGLFLRLIGIITHIPGLNTAGINVVFDSTLITPFYAMVRGRWRFWRGAGSEYQERA
jgi:hypothetical protein